MSSVPLFSYLLPFVLVVGFIGIIFFLRNMRLNRLAASFQRLARDLGVSYIEPQSSWFKETFPSVDGSIFDRRVCVWMFGRGGHRHRYYYTKIEVGCKNQHYTLGLNREDFANRIGKFFGGQDIIIGDEHIDKKFIIKSNREEFVVSFFNHNMKALLANHYPKFKGKLELKDGVLAYEEMYELDSDKNIEKTIAHIEFLVKMAERIEETATMQS